MSITLTTLNSKYIHTNLAIRYKSEARKPRGLAPWMNGFFYYLSFFYRHRKSILAEFKQRK